MRALCASTLRPAVHDRSVCCVSICSPCAQFANWRFPDRFSFRQPPMTHQRQAVREQVPECRENDCIRQAAGDDVRANADWRQQFSPATIGPFSGRGQVGPNRRASGAFRSQSLPKAFKLLSALMQLEFKRISVVAAGAATAVYPAGLRTTVADYSRTCSD